MVNSQANGTTSSYASARLERALPRIEREWIPFNKSQLDRIIAAYRAGAYDIDPERLIEELARDVGAITWLIHQAIAEGAHGSSPLEVVQTLTAARAIELLEARRTTTHSFENSTTEQLSVLRCSAVAIGAAAGFAPSVQVCLRDAMGAELLMQVGRLLVAWNYPLAFARAAKGDQNRSIDDRISDEIGFSPLMLSHLLATRWSIDDRFTRLTDSLLIEENDKPLARLCEISEALAQAEVPQFFPEARARFEDASQAVRDSLGPLGLKTLEAQIAEITNPYSALLGVKFCPIDGVQLGRVLNDAQESPHRSHAALVGCRIEVRAAVKQLLIAIEPTAVDVGAAKRCMENLVPLCGFSAACIYVFDPFTKVFRQRLSTGVWYRPMQVAVHELAPGDLPHQLAGVFSGNQIQVTNGDSLDVPSFLAVPLGTKTHIGVLCLEAQLLSLDDSGLALIHAKAVRMILERALKS